MRDETTELLKNLMRINSISGNELEISKFIFSFLKQKGFNPTLIEKPVPNIYCKVGNGSIYLNSHMDTVDVADGWLTNPFKPKIIENKMYGLGAFDMKAGVAIQLSLFAELADKVDGMFLNCVSDEELVSTGTYAAIKSGMIKNCKCGIFSEPSSLNDKYELRIGGRGRYVFDVLVKAEGGHGGRSKTPNAIIEAAKLITALDKIEVKSHPLMGAGFLNVEDILSGTKGFMSSPAECKFKISRIAVLGENYDFCYKQILDVVKFSKLNAEVIIKPVSRATPFIEPALVDEKEKIVMAAKEAFERNSLMPAITAPSVYDLNFAVNLAKIPSVNIGPLGGNLHKANEFVDLESVKVVKNVIGDLIKNIR